MKKLLSKAKSRQGLVWLMLLCLVISVAMVSTAYCPDDGEKEPPEGYVDEGPDLADPAPEKPPLGVYPVWYDIILIAAGVIVVGYISLVTYLHYRKEE